MSIYKAKKKWRSVKATGKVVRKIYKDGKIIYDLSKPLSNPVVGEQLVKIEASTNIDWTVPYSGWFRIEVAAAGGGSDGSTGGGGARIVYDIYLEKGQRIIAWSATRVSGAPAKLKGGNGAYDNGYSSYGNYGKLGGGGASGKECGGGGGGAAGDGAAITIRYGGGGSGAIIYSGDDLIAWGTADVGMLFTRSKTPQAGDIAYNVDGTPTGNDTVVKSFDSTTNTVTFTSLAGDSQAKAYNADSSYIAYEHDENWQILILCGGGGGGFGHSESYRAGGGGGGGGTSGGYTNWSGGGGCDYNLSGSNTPGNGSRYSNGGAGSGNVIDVRDPANPKLLATRTAVTSAGWNGWVNIWALH